MAILCAGIIIFAVCMCCWSVRRPEYREDAYVVEPSGDYKQVGKDQFSFRCDFAPNSVIWKILH